MWRTPVVAAVSVAVGVALGATGTAVASHVQFSDVSDGDVHAEGIHWASENRLVTGFPDGTFRPSAGVTRGQLATILERQGAFVGPTYRLTPDCGSLDMSIFEANGRGSGLASVTYSVDGGERREIVGPIPQDGTPFTFTAAEPGLVTVYVDGIAQVNAPTGETCS